MKYWTLFTLRMAALLGLLLALVTWYSAYTTTLQTHVNNRSWALYAITNLEGCAAGIIPASPGTRVWRYWIDPQASEHTMFDEFTTVHWIIPGVEYRGSKVMLGHSLQIDHWFICVTFLIATFATSVRWRKMPAESEQAI